MANRDVYYVTKDGYNKVDVSFKWYPGFAKVQKQRSIRSLHDNFNAKFPNNKVIEISSASENQIGVDSSAFNLKMKTTHGTFEVEQLFQSAKVFSKSGSQVDSLKLTPKEAKKLSYKLNKSEDLVGFYLFDLKFPLVPRTLFYDWLYLNALLQNKVLAKSLMDYDAFTDINVKPNYTINSQAKSCAIFVFLVNKHGMDGLKQLLKMENINAFISEVYGDDFKKLDLGNHDNNDFTQTKLF